MPITTDPSLMRQVAAEHDAIAAEIDAARATTDTAPVSDTSIGGDPTGYDPALGDGADFGATDPATTPAAGPLPTAVVPVTGITPATATAPPGAAAVTQPTPTAGGSGFAPMPMGMPMGAGSGNAPAATAESRARKLASPRTPHTEPVAGKLPEERIALPVTKPRGDASVVRRVTMPPDTKE
jgi:hypothetical protein